MSRIRIKDKTFETSLTEDAIRRRVGEVARQLSRDLEGRNPLLVAVLNGAFIFAADLMRAMTTPCEITFVKMASYDGTASTGHVRELMGVDRELEGRHVVVVEDIVDSGLTMQHMVKRLADYKPASVRICTLFSKPGNLKVQLPLDYVAFEIPNDFIVGYGLDYDQQGRGLSEIYTLAEED